MLILDHNFSIIGSFKIDNMGSNPIVRIAAGDLNGDNYADLVVVYGKNFNDTDKLCRYFIFQGGADGLGIGLKEASPSAIAVASDIVQGETGSQFCSGEVAIADYNGDGLNEIVFAGVSNTDGNLSDTNDWGGAYLHPYALVWDPYNETQEVWRRSFPKTATYDFGRVTNSNHSCHPLNFYAPRIAVGRFDGGKKDMFLVGDVILTVNDSGELVRADNQPFGSHNGDSFQNMKCPMAPIRHR